MFEPTMKTRVLERDYRTKGSVAKNGLYEYFINMSTYIVEG